MLGHCQQKNINQATKQSMISENIIYVPRSWLVKIIYFITRNPLVSTCVSILNRMA